MASWKIALGLILSAIGVFCGTSSFVFFFFGNYRAAVWALISGLLAAVDFHLLFLSWRNTLNSWHTATTIRDFELLAMGGLVSGVTAAIWYMFMFVYYNMNILPVETSYPIAAVWAGMTAKWGIGLLLTTRHLAAELADTSLLSPRA